MIILTNFEYISKVDVDGEGLVTVGLRIVVIVIELQLLAYASCKLDLLTFILQ